MDNEKQILFVCAACIIIILLVMVARQVFGAEPASAIPRADAIKILVEPKTKHPVKLPYGSKRMKAYKSAEYRVELARAFEFAGRVFNLPPNLLIALGYRETVLRTGLTGSRGERGILQVMPRSARICQRYCGDLDSAEGGALCGACWFKRGLRHCGDYRGAVSAYVSGRCEAYSRKVKQAVQNRLWLWAYLNRLTGETK